MKCDQAQTWLSMSDSQGDSPAAVTAHLQECASCRQVQERLLLVERAAAGFFGTGESAKQRFLTHFKDAATPPAPVRLESKRRGHSGERSRLIVSIGTAAAILVIAGATWLAFSGRGGRDLPVVEKSPLPGDPLEVPKSAAPHTPNEEVIASSGNAPNSDDDAPNNLADDSPLLNFLLENHLQLAAATTPEDRLVFVDQLSKRIWNEVVRQSPKMDPVELTLLGELHERVVLARQPGDVATLLTDDSPLRQERIEELRHRSQEAEHLASKSQDGIAIVLQKISTSSRLAADQLANNDNVAVPRAELPLSDSLVAQVVDQSLKLANETDPIRRAEYCTAVANRISQTIELSANRGESRQSEILGGYLGDIIDYGVMANLEAYKPVGPDDPRRAEVARVKKTGLRAVEVLERKLESAPDAAREGLVRALEAKKHGRRKGPPAGRGPPPGKGPPPGGGPMRNKGPHPGKGPTQGGGGKPADHDSRVIEIGRRGARVASATGATRAWRRLRHHTFRHAPWILPRDSDGPLASVSLLSRPVASFKIVFSEIGAPGAIFPVPMHG